MILTITYFDPPLVLPKQNSKFEFPAFFVFSMLFTVHAYIFTIHTHREKEKKKINFGKPLFRTQGNNIYIKGEKSISKIKTIKAQLKQIKVYTFILMASLIIVYQSSLHRALVLQFRTPRAARSFSTSWIQRLRGRPLLLVPNIVPSRVFFAILPSSILITWPNHSSLLARIKITISQDPYSSYSSQFLRILHSPSSTTGP